MIILDHLYFCQKLLGQGSLSFPCPSCTYDIPDNVISNQSFFRFIWYPDQVSEPIFTLETCPTELSSNIQTRLFNSNHLCFVCGSSGVDKLDIGSYIDSLLQLKGTQYTTDDVLNLSIPNLGKVVLLHWLFYYNSVITTEALRQLVNTTKLEDQIIMVSLYQQLLSLEQFEINKLP